MKKIYLFSIPAVLALAGLLYKSSCVDGYCFFSGRGFPLGYVHDNAFYFGVFFLNYLFFFLLCAIPVIILQRKRKRNETANKG